LGESKLKKLREEKEFRSSETGNVLGKKNSDEVSNFVFSDDFATFSERKLEVHNLVSKES
jgi:hypothetical protein